MNRQRSLHLGLTIPLILWALTAQAHPLYPQNNEPPWPVPQGTWHEMWRDWADTTPLANTRPDHSFKSIWVRMFPLVSVPLGDPYPDTVDYNSISLSNDQGFKVYSLSGQQLLGSGKTIALNFSAGTVRLDKKTLSLQPLWIAPVSASSNSLLVWDKGKKTAKGGKAEVQVRERGGFVVKKSIHAPKDRPETQELWSVINVVALNDYLRSVVPSEVLASWLPETLKAQAIAARTYAMFEMALARAQNQDFDVDPSTWYQSYQGQKFWNRDNGVWHNVELSSTSDAVQKTGGEVILYKGEVIKAYFSSNSGGFTCTVRECLELDMDPGYIREVQDHPQVRKAPGGTWGTHATLTPSAIHGVLVSLGINPTSPVTRLEHLEKGPSGRTWRLRVDLQNKTHIDLDRLQTRKIMHLFGPIRSFLYYLQTPAGGKQPIIGYGYGHAVGMSQWGAQLYAKDGWKAHTILQHYYHDVTIKDLSASLD